MNQALAELQAELEARAAEAEFWRYRPYGHPDTLSPGGELFKRMGWGKWSNKPWQLEFHQMGRDCFERAIIAAIGTGKSYAASWETACHMMGEYPEWWEGYRFDKPVKVWIASIDADQQREGVQTHLLGKDMDKNLGTGYIPRSRLAAKPKVRQAGISEVCDRFAVKHRSGGVSVASFKCHPAGERVLMASGEWKPIERVRVGERVRCADGVARRATQMHLYENAPVIEIRTTSGILRTTPNHPVFTARGKIDAAEVVVGDILEVAHPECGEERREEWEEFLTGLLIGDGCFRGKTVGLSCFDDDVLAEVRRVLPDDLTVRAAPSAKHGNWKIVGKTPNRNRMLDSLRKSGLWGKKADQKRLPTWVFRLAREGRLNVLRGLWASDGNVTPGEARYTSCSRALCEDVRALCWSVGLSPRVNTSNDRHHYVYVSRPDRIAFNVIGKIGRDNSVGPSNGRARPLGLVSEVVEMDPQDVFGLGVPPVHELIVEGFRVGNTYAQGWRSFQAAAPNIVQFDEEPDERDTRQRDVFNQMQARVFRSGGLLYGAMTPELGETDITRHFMFPKHEAVGYVGASWDDAPHLDVDQRERLEKTYPDHLRQTKIHGLPMMGEGRIFKVPEDDISVAPFDVPRHYAQIAGIDFGISSDNKHPTAIAWLAWDRHQDVLYLIGDYRRANELAVVHAEALKRRGKWIPVAWPHDGHKRDAGYGIEIQKHYRDAGVNMLPISARYDKDRGGRQDPEPAIEALAARMETGRFYAFSNCVGFWEEYRSWHRKDGKPVAYRDDLMKALLYATMMLEYAYTQPSHRMRRPAAMGHALQTGI